MTKSQTKANIVSLKFRLYPNFLTFPPSLTFFYPSFLIIKTIARKKNYCKKNKKSKLKSKLTTVQASKIELDGYIDAILDISV